jgi:hypothetical protein
MAGKIQLGAESYPSGTVYQSVHQHEKAPRYLKRKK